MDNAPENTQPMRDNLALNEFQARRADALAALPRIGTSPITDLARFRFNLEEIALSLGNQLAARQAAGDPHAWQLQDVLDDALDALDALKNPNLLSRAD